MNQAVLFMFALVFMWAIYQLGLRTLRCRYCGGIVEHDDDCPLGRGGLR